MKKSSKTFVLSDETVNRYGFKTITAGIDREDFDQNPVLLYDHNYEKLIGIWTDIRVEGTQLLGVPSFDEEDPYAMQQYSKVEQGILNGASIGILPVHYDSTTDTMHKSSLLECSLTPVPANRKAIAIYNDQRQKLNSQEAKAYLLSLTPAENFKTENNKMNEKLIQALVALCVQAGQVITLSTTSTEAEVEGAINKVKEKVMSLSASNVILTTQLNALNSAAETAKMREIEGIVDNAINAKLLTADKRAQFIDLGKYDLEILKTSLSLVTPVAVTSPVVGAQATSLSISGRETWTFDDYALKAPQDLERMQVIDPDTFAALLSAKQKSVRSNGSVAL